jgi:hypothetical protein
MHTCGPTAFILALPVTAMAPMYVPQRTALAQCPWPLAPLQDRLQAVADTGRTPVPDADRRVAVTPLMAIYDMIGPTTPDRWAPDAVAAIPDDTGPRDAVPNTADDKRRVLQTTDKDVLRVDHPWGEATLAFCNLSVLQASPGDIARALGPEKGVSLAPAHDLRQEKS